MAKSSVDRRVVRTRAMLQHALISLILKKGYEAITIEDICDAADVGRSTFYAHYTSKDDLKRSGLENLRRLLVDRQREVLATPGDVIPRLSDHDPCAQDRTPMDVIRHGCSTKEFQA